MRSVRLSFASSFCLINDTRLRCSCSPGTVLRFIPTTAGRRLAVGSQTAIQVTFKCVADLATSGKKQVRPSHHPLTEISRPSTVRHSERRVQSRLHFDGRWHIEVMGSERGPSTALTSPPFTFLCLVQNPQSDGHPQGRKMGSMIQGDTVKGVGLAALSKLQRPKEEENKSKQERPREREREGKGWRRSSCCRLANGIGDFSTSCVDGEEPPD
ncbi:hypothetical protein BHE74_00039533 [Ensete ventricosum]|nr:hypothetical protein BHE74_00039533 [Ensete ventricosum]